MKLLIKHKYFKDIKDKKKRVEYRSAHITFIDDETGEQLRKKVFGVCMLKEYEVDMPKKEKKELFKEGEDIIAFYLED